MLRVSGDNQSLVRCRWVHLRSSGRCSKKMTVLCTSWLGVRPRRVIEGRLSKGARRTHTSSEQDMYGME